MKDRVFDRAPGAPPSPERDGGGALSAVGAAAAAIASSACCWLPLALLAFGASAAGASAFFERWRPYFAVAAIAMLGFGFYSAYFRASACGNDGCCNARARRRLRLTRTTLWIAAVVVVAFVSFPKYAGGLLEALGTHDRSATVSAATAWRFDVQGMTCEVCAVTLRTDLATLDGVESAEVDYTTKSAIVRSPDPAVIERVREAATRHGYTATHDPDKGNTP
jgi:copper chaperone CopZ